MSPVIYIAIAAFAIGAASSWQVQNWRAGYNENQRREAVAREEHTRAERIDTAAEKREVEKAAIEERYVVITERVEHEIQASPFYAGSAPACLDDNGLRELRAAIGHAAAASQPAPPVPPASHPR